MHHPRAKFVHKVIYKKALSMFTHSCRIFSLHRIFYFGWHSRPKTKDQSTYPTMFAMVFLQICSSHTESYNLIAVREKYSLSELGSSSQCKSHLMTMWDYSAEIQNVRASIHVAVFSYVRPRTGISHQRKLFLMVIL